MHVPKTVLNFYYYFFPSEVLTFSYEDDDDDNNNSNPILPSDVLPLSPLPSTFSQNTHCMADGCQTFSNWPEIYLNHSTFGGLFLFFGQRKESALKGLRKCDRCQIIKEWMKYMSRREGRKTKQEAKKNKVKSGDASGFFNLVVAGD